MIVVEIAGTGCVKCKRMKKNVEKAVKDLGIKAKVIEVKDIDEIIKRGVMSTPSLIINGELRSHGQMKSPEQIKKILREYM